MVSSIIQMLVSLIFSVVKTIVNVTGILQVISDIYLTDFLLIIPIPMKKESKCIDYWGVFCMIREHDHITYHVKDALPNFILLYVNLMMIADDKTFLSAS